MNAENAILTKARAMYAGRLTKKNYNEMLQCKNVHDVAAYLKSKTHYSAPLEKLNISSIHRGWLEANLKNVIYENIESLSHYDYTLGDKFYQYFIVAGEISQITRCVTLINTGTKEKYLRTLPDFFNERSQLDLITLGKAETLEELLRVLEGTPYYEISRRFISKNSAEIDMVGFSRALDQYSFEKMFELIDETSHGKHREALINYAQTAVDVYNIDMVYRVNKLRRYGSSLQYTMVAVSGGSLPDKLLAELAEAPDEKTFMRLFRSTKYGKYLSQESYDYIELATRELLYRLSLHALRFSVYPSVVMLSYVTLLEIELQNIIHIVEGIRYNVRTDAIQKLLVGADD